MKKFLIKTSLFVLVPLVTWLLIEVILPPTFFAGPFQGLRFETDIPRTSEYWYPNSEVSVLNAGDLCHHTIKAILKNEAWVVDKAGFRNYTFIEDPDVVFIGDSFFGGGGLTQNDMVSNIVQTRLHNALKVYCMAPSSLTAFDRLLKTGKIKTPKIIIFSVVERNVPGPLLPYASTSILKIKYAIKELFGIGKMNVYYDKAFRMYSISWLKARLHHMVGMGKPAVGNDSLYFLQGVSQKHTENQLNATATTIITYKKYCDNLGVKFLFVPMPDKESVYYEFVPFDKQADYLFRLDSILKANGVNTINTLAIYNQYRATHSALLYQLDDTHWNRNATSLIADEIIKNLSQNLQN